MIFAAIVLYFLAALSGFAPHLPHFWEGILLVVALVIVIVGGFGLVSDPRYGRWL